MEHEKVFYNHEPEPNEGSPEALAKGPQTHAERALFQGLGRSASTGMRSPSGLPITEREVEMKKIMERQERTQWEE